MNMRAVVNELGSGIRPILASHKQQHDVVADDWHGYLLFSPCSGGITPSSLSLRRLLNGATSIAGLPFIVLAMVAARARIAALGFGVARRNTRRDWLGLRAACLLIACTGR